jgi:hypothetical protein
VTTFVAVVPGVPALLPERRSRIDPVPELRHACREAIAWLTEHSRSRITLKADPSQLNAKRVADTLLAESGFTNDVVNPASTTDPTTEGRGLLVVANGSARRGEKAPGHLDARSFEFDQQLEAALGTGDAAALGAIDKALGDELLAEGLEAMRSLASFADAHVTPTMLYAGDPYGVRYWVVTWECAP